MFKSFLKNKFSIAISGNAFIGEKHLKDFFTEFLDGFEDDVKYDILVNGIKKLYDSSTKHSTKYFISFYDKISPTSNYRFYYNTEPFIYCLDTSKMHIEIKNEDEDGFTYGFFWGGENNNRIAISLTKKRLEIDANKLTIRSSIELIKDIFQEVESDFIDKNEFPTISRQFDLTIQTPVSSQIIRNFVSI